MFNDLKRQIKRPGQIACLFVFTTQKTFLRVAAVGVGVNQFLGYETLMSLNGYQK